jgi:very-short-patch-repair endonuclease
MKGYTFNRQRPVINYIADFMSKELFLIIEVDGMYHNREDILLKDEVRQKSLEDAGYKVIRFKNEHVLKDIKNVISAIEIVVEERERELGLKQP